MSLGSWQKLLMTDQLQGRIAIPFVRDDKRFNNSILKSSGEDIGVSASTHAPFAWFVSSAHAYCSCCSVENNAENVASINPTSMCFEIAEHTEPSKRPSAALFSFFSGTCRVEKLRVSAAHTSLTARREGNRRYYLVNEPHPESFLRGSQSCRQAEPLSLAAADNLCHQAFPE